MRIRRLIGVAVAASVLVVGVGGCTVQTAVVTPVVVTVDDLQGATIRVPLNSALVIITDWSDVDGYTAEIADPAISAFLQGSDAGDVSYSPRLTPRRVGKTEVTLFHAGGGIRNVEFTLEVTPEAPGNIRMPAAFASA